jgi:CheY-like chemotaxis protein
MNHNPVILYVEDDAKSRTIMNLLLKSRMALEHVTIFEDSTDFLTRLRSLNPAPNIIFLDIHLKPYNGFEMLAMLRLDPVFRKTPVVALTASVMNEEVQQLRTMGFDGCLAKPIELDSFPEILERLLNGETIWRIID